MNPSGPLDEQLRFAIANKRLIDLTYGDAARLVEAHDYGLQNGKPKLLVYQRRKTGGAARRSDAGWRMLEVAKIDRCIVLEETFAGSRGTAHQHHYAWDVVYARVT